MATVVFRPELTNPPLDPEVLMGFSFPGRGMEMVRVSLKAGLNREIPDHLWDQCKELDKTRELLSLGALREEASISEDEALVPSRSAKQESLNGIDLHKSLQWIDECHDPELLKQWHTQEHRIRLRNAITKRISTLTEGDA